jgi:2-polyprenyl-6-hydroxyphenyl methylase/3-demethylubiquinone-9 3-methyltransferase
MGTTNPSHRVNNAIYETLGDRWYEAQDDPIALLRAESAHRTPWIIETVERRHGTSGVRALDIGCGAGFLANRLAVHGWHVAGIDASGSSREVAARREETCSVRYEVGDARSMPFRDGSFDVACAMDFLEHVEEPGRVIAEAARVLRPGGSFFFHTFNRTLLAWLVVIKGVEWFVKNTPRDLHVLSMFLEPESLKDQCAASGLEVVETRGLRPVMLSKAFVQLLATGVVPKDFAFTFTPSTKIAYTGFAQKLIPQA